MGEPAPRHLQAVPRPRPSKSDWSTSWPLRDRSLSSLLPVAERQGCHRRHPGLWHDSASWEKTHTGLGEDVHRSAGSIATVISDMAGLYTSWPCPASCSGPRRSTAPSPASRASPSAPPCCCHQAPPYRLPETLVRRREAVRPRRPRHQTSVCLDLSSVDTPSHEAPLVPLASPLHPKRLRPSLEEVPGLLECQPRPAPRWHSEHSLAVVPPPRNQCC